MKYADIINLDRPFSLRKKMSIEDRAGQFMPFSALTGYEEIIDESSRIVDSKIELDENQKTLINIKLQSIFKDKYNLPEVEVLYFLKDLRKNGGSYITYKGKLKKYDVDHKRIIFIDSKIINIDDILEISIL